MILNTINWIVRTAMYQGCVITTELEVMGPTNEGEEEGIPLKVSNTSAMDM